MAQVRFDPIKPLTELEQIMGQVEAAKDVDRESRALAKVWERIAENFDTALTGVSNSEGNYVKASGAVSAGALAEGAAAARKVAEALNPIAEVNWTKETVEELLVSVRFFLISNVYDPEQTDRAQRVIEKAGVLTKTRVSGGTRLPAPVVEGRPEYVEVTATFGDEPERISRQKGNSENSPGNILKAVKSWLERNNVEVTEVMADQITDAINRSLRDGEREVEIGDFAVIRHAA